MMNAFTNTVRRTAFKAAAKRYAGTTVRSTPAVPVSCVVLADTLSWIPVVFAFTHALLLLLLLLLLL